MRSHGTPISSPAVPSASLPSEDHPVWGDLIKGVIQHEFTYAAAGMLLFNLSLQWRRNPSHLPHLIQQARTFFLKYQHLLVHDIQKLFT